MFWKEMPERFKINAINIIKNDDDFVFAGSVGL